MDRRTLLLSTLVLLAGACSSPPPAAAVVEPYIPFDGTAPHTRPIGSVAPGAQRAFDQGLSFLWSFNHDEAISSFTEVTVLDPQCPMGYWGIAVALGPHINNPALPPEKEHAAWQAAQKAVALQDRANAADRALIAAVAKRYGNPPGDRSVCDHKYAEAMRAALAANPNDADIGALCAEALMDLHPWDLWTPAGEPKEGTLEIVALLDGVLRLDPQHPGALHLYIHAVEASKDPGRALAVADRLRDLVPVSGHMCHMPSHIDVLLGHWDEAILSNEKAIAADKAYTAARPHQEFHHMYMAHNQAMLAFAAMMDGRSAQAIATARQILPVAASYAHEVTPAIEPSFVILYDTLIRFGRWDEMLAEPEPPDDMVVALVLWHHARGVALAALGRVDDAQDELEAFRDAAADVPPDRALAINNAHVVFDIADRMLAGEIAWARHDVDGAVSELQQAIALEDQLAYMEPPEWALPVRHALGAILLSAGRADEAEAVYRADLVQWPENGWSLHGLADCLERQGKTAEAADARARFDKAWGQADIQIGSSCLCVAGGAAPVSAP
jgi:tetratricopeptide (TPR) repeat protein